jgi:hypothetical protein
MGVCIELYDLADTVCFEMNTFLQSTVLCLCYLAVVTEGNTMILRSLRRFVQLNYLLGLCRLCVWRVQTVQNIRYFVITERQQTYNRDDIIIVKTTGNILLLGFCV